MANDKKFIVKNGLLTPENAVIGSTTDTGETLQVTGDSVLTQATQGTATLKVKNTGGHSAATIIAAFEGDSDSLQIRNISAGDYKITNPGVDNSIEFHDDTAGIVINYAGTEIAAFTSTGINFTGVATTTIDDNRILTTADEGSGNNLDADTVDGLEASQFLRSDVADSAAGTISFLQDIDVTGSAQIDTNITVDGTAVIKSLLDAQANAQVAGNLTVGGDFTVSGNTTYVNTEEILLSDNIITLNANYTGSTPTENAGIEVERGTLANPKLVWNETSDYWQLEVDGGVLGRVITTADEGSGNGFDADTVDGLEAAQFLRSDADDTATGNITIEGDLTVGDGAGAAQINFATTGQDRVLYGNNGTVGFLKNDNSGWNASSDTDGDWNVSRDVEAGRNVIADDDITATSGNISATAGSVSAGTTVTGGTDVIATTGNVSATVGNVTAGNDVTAAQDITATAGNISATAGSVAAGTTVTAGTDVIGQRFVDADDNSYLVNPAANSTMHAIGIDDDLYHNGDTNTKLSFTTDDISLQTGGAERLGIQNDSVTASVDVYAPNIVVNDAVIHNNDTDTKVSFATDTINLETGGSTRLTANNSGVTVTGDLDVTGNLTAVDGTFSGDLSAARFLDSDDPNYYADPASTSVMNRIGINDYIQHNDDTNTFFGFDSNDNIIFTTNAVERFEINATNITGTVDAIFPDVYAGRFYDLNNATYYVDPASNSRLNSIGLVGTIFHDGDTNTYLNFNADDSFEIVTGGTQGLEVTTFTTAAGSVRSPLFYDVDDTNYYGDFAGTSQMSQIDIDSYIRHRGDTNNYFGFDAADSQTFVTGGVERLNITDANSTFSHPVIVQGDVQADRFVDRNATGYFVHPGDTTLAATFAGAVRIENITNNSRWDDTSGNGGIALMGYGDGNGSTSNPSIAMSGNYSGGYSLMYLNRIDAGNNPANDGNRYIEFGADGTNYSTIRGDASGNMYQVLASGKTWGFWNSAYTEVLIADDNANVMVATGSAPTYTDGGDNTALTTTPSNPKLHVGGSIYLNGNDDGIIFGRGTASFLKSEELAFGLGSGLYMADATYLRIRNNTTLYSTGNADFNQFRSYQDTAYYVDPDGDSQLNTVDIDDYIRHRGDTNTYIGFPADDSIELTTGGGIRGQINNTRTRVRNKLEVYGSGIELQKPTNGSGVGITMTDESGELAGLAGLQQASIKVWHEDNAVTTGAGLAMVFDSSEASTHYVFGESNGTVGATVIPRVNAQGNLGLSTYRWGNSYITSGDYVNLTVTNEISAPGVSGYANYLKSRDNRIIIPNEDTSERLRFGFTSWNNDNTAPYADYLHFRSYGDSLGGSDNLLMIKKSGLGMRLWQQTFGSSTAYSSYVDFPLYNVNPGTGNDFYADRFIDTDNTAYFADPAGESRLATIKLEDGVILRSPNGTFGSLTVSGTGRSGYEGFSINDRVVFMHNNTNTSGIYNDVNNHWLFRGENGGETAMYYNGSQQGSAENGFFLGQNEVRSPIFYDSVSTGYYADLAATTRLNTIQALRYYFNHATTYYADAASGDYGSMEVGGTKGGYAGYSIAGQWNFMSDGPNTSGIYNDTDNEWSLIARRNAEVELYYNGVEQASTRNGYFEATNQMRAPIFYDLDDPTYYLNPAAGNLNRSLMIDGRIYREGFDTSGNGDTNKVIEAQDYSHWTWNTAGNWGTFWAGDAGAAYQHFGSSNPNEYVFVGSGNVRASIDLDDGNAYFQGTASASDFALNGGNENISLNPAYGSGGADLVLFDMTKYFEARVIQGLSGPENSLTTTTSEYVKNSDGPFAGSYVLRTSAYRDFDSDYIPVSPGEDIYGEVSTRLISGSGGLLYMGVRRYDKDKNPIAGNDGIEYFVVGGSNRTSTDWETLRAHTTIPATHTPYNGSDGGACRFVRLILLFNYNAGGALRELGGVMLKRRNAESNLLVDDLRVADQLNVDGNAFITGDLTVDDITADIVDANIFRDRDNTAYYVDPASTDTSVNVRGVIQNPSVWINDGDNFNAYNENIRLFNASNGVSVIAFSATGNAGAPATSILGYPTYLETRRVNDWQQRTYAGSAEFVGDIRPTLMYDRNDTAWYVDPNALSRIKQLDIEDTASQDILSVYRTGSAPGNYTGSRFINQYGDHSWGIVAEFRIGDKSAQSVPSGTDRPSILFSTGYNATTWSVGFGFTDNDFRIKQDHGHINGGWGTERFRINTSGEVFIGNNLYGTNAYFNRYYDRDDTGYYADPASTSVFNAATINGSFDFNGGANAIQITSSDIRSNGDSTWTGDPGAGVGKIQMHSNRWYIVSNGNSNRIVQFRQNGADRSYIANDGRLIGVGGTGSQDFRAPIFYDTDNTGYYGNFAGTSVMNNINIDDYVRHNGDTDTYIGFDAVDNFGVWTNSANRLRIDNDSADFAVNVYAPSYYDSNNPSYYGDFASTSYMNDVRANIFYERENTAYYFGSSQGDFRMRNGRLDTVDFYGTARHQVGNASYWYTAAGNLRGYIQATDTDDAHLIIATSGGEDISFRDGGLGGAWNMIIRGDGQTLINSRIDSPIFYDRNDTGYYADPNATSIFRRLTINESLNGYLPDNFGRFRWSTGLFNNGTSTANFVADLGDNEALAQGFTAQKVPWSYAGNSDVNTGIQNIEMAGTSIATWHDGSYFTSLVIRPTTGAGGGSVYIYNDQGSGYSPGWRQVATSTTDFFNTVSVRSPIFYDQDDTTYRVDPNGTSIIRYLKVNTTGTSSGTRALTIKDQSVGEINFGSYPASWTSALQIQNNNGSNFIWISPLDDGYNARFRTAGSGLDFYTNGGNNTGEYSLFVGSGYAQGIVSLRAPLFYDSDNTGYYLDPAGASNLATSVRVNEFYARGWFRNDSSGTGLYNQATAMHWYSDSSSRFRLYSTSSTSQILFTTTGDTPRGYAYADNSNNIGFLNNGGSWSLRMDSAGNSFHTASARAPVFYDNNDTTYYGDFNSTSDAAVRQRGGTLHGPNITWGRYLAVGGNGRYNNEASVATTDGNLHLDSRSGNNLYLQWYVGGTTFVNGSMQADIYYDRNDTNYYGNFASTSYMNDVRANIFYDRNNTAFYFGSGSGDSRFNSTRVNECYNDAWFRNYNAGQGLYNQATGRHIYSPGSSYWHLDGAAGSGGLIIYDRYQASQGAAAGRRGYLYYDGSGFGLLHSGGGWAFRISPGSTTTEQFGVSYMSDARAYIYYDRDNTAYYFDGASVNSTRFEGVSNRTKAMMGLPGRTGFSAEYYSARPRITGDVNYWTGSMGWGRIDMNSVAHWGSGFIDSWSNPPNQPSGTSHWVGTQAFHYTNNSTVNYGWQMVGGPIENLRFRSSWSGWRSWRTIPVLGVNSNNNAAMYANIYYDSDNTGFYMDPTAFTNLNTGVRATDIYARSWFRNDAARSGIYNQATGVHAYSYQAQYYAITGNNNSSTMSLQLRATNNGTMCRWMYGDRTWSGDLNAAGQWQLQTRHQDGYSPTLRFIESGNESWTGNIGNDAGKIEYHANRFYIEAGGNSDRICQFRRNGSDRSYVDNNGLYVGTATSARWADLAERYSADDMYDNATVMGMNLNGDSEITKYEPGMPLVGVISTNPAVQMNDMGIEPGSNSKKARMNPFIALKGRIPCKVSQPVKKGQWVIPDADGKAKGVDYGTPGINSYEIIGIALSDSENGEVEVKV